MIHFLGINCAIVHIKIKSVCEENDNIAINKFKAYHIFNKSFHFIKNHEEIVKNNLDRTNLINGATIRIFLPANASIPTKFGSFYLVIRLNH